MKNVTTMRITDIDELKRLAWKVGIVYFQIYTDRPNRQFYAPLSECLPHELIVEVPTNQWRVIASQLGHRGGAPVFGATSGGWIIALSEDPNHAQEIVEGARKLAVLPSMKPNPRSPAENITLEGL